MQTEKTKLQQKHHDAMQTSRAKALARKKRTHRLIVRGAIAEKLFPDSEQMTDEEFEQNLFRVVQAGNLYLDFQKDYYENKPSADSSGSSRDNYVETPFQS